MAIKFEEARKRKEFGEFEPKAEIGERAIRVTGERVKAVTALLEALPSKPKALEDIVKNPQNYNFKVLR